MSLVGKRATIAAALSEVDGIRGHEYRPAAPKTGDAWPLLGNLERSAGLTFIATWRVFVFLPQDERQASVYIDDKVEALVDALEPEGFIDQVAPAQLATTEQYVLQIVMRSE